MADHNTPSSPLLHKAYGRWVQNMVQQALDIEDRDERTTFAHRIVEVMKSVSGQTRPSQEVWVKLWNHLAQMSDHRLDIDYPCAIEPHAEDQRPPRLPYPSHPIRLRHYGALLERLTSETAASDDATHRAAMLRAVVTRMKRNLSELRGGATDVRRAANDIEMLTDAKITAEEVLAALGKTSA